VEIASGSTPKTKARLVIRIGRSRSGGFDRGVEGAHALAHPLLGELDDQDRVLRRHADRGDQADLQVDVVVEAGQPRREQRADTPSGTTRITEIGTDQLSYSAARQRNTISSDSA
jgi:hypothetical protein